jgi:hypothetical protein
VADAGDDEGLHVVGVNVSVNPAGRCGAPETEPGPSGAGKPADDEVMRIPFHERYCLTIARRAGTSRP